MEKGSTHKPIEELNIMDDFLFNELVMDKEYGEAFIQYFLKTVLDCETKIKDVKVQLIHTSGDTNKRAIRMDVVTQGVILPKDINPITGEMKETFIDIEMQKQQSLTEEWKDENLRNRSRLYQAMLDVSLLSPGQHFGELPNVLIIICMPFDLFGRDRMMYSFTYRCEEEADLVLEDGGRRIFLNTKGKKGARKELKEMLKYIEDSTKKNVVSPELETIHNMVNSVKQNKKVGVRYMLAIEHDLAMKEEGRKEGKEEGRKEGKEEGREEGIKALILDNLEENISSERIILKLQKRFTLSKDKAKEKFNKYNNSHTH